MKKKKRIDLLLVERDLAPTRSRAHSLILAGDVFVDGERVDKAGTLVPTDSQIEIKGSGLKYVSRGGIKLEEAIKKFDIKTEGKVALDVGASTGGFTDCLLQHGVRKVYALDVGYGQLDWRLRNDSKVVVMERFNARYLKPEDIGEPVDIAAVDVSFISLTLVIVPVLRVLKSPGGVVITLIKPQFEVGKGEVGKGGIVRDERKHRLVIDKVVNFSRDLGLDVLGVIPSPILGADGNREFLMAALY